MNITNKEKLEALGIDLKGIREQGKTLCPKCSHTRKKKREPCLNVNITDGTYNCWNPGCGFHGKVGGEREYKPKPKEYVRPKFNNRTVLTDGVVGWFFKRGIEQDTLIKGNVKDGPAWMPQIYRKHYTEAIEKGFTEDKAKEFANKEAVVLTIQFEYYRNGELINRKYRDVQKNFRMEKDAELIFYGYDDVKDSDWCIIVEGEPDKLAWLQAGVKEVISVPNGAVESKNPEDLKLEYLDNCVELFENKTKIILATDDDEPGRFLREELSRRLGQDRCYKVDFGGIKDSNDYLVENGSEKLRALINPENLIEYPLSGIVTLNDVDDLIEDILLNGFPKGEKIGLKPLDELITWLAGYFVAITGIPNHGKSPFTIQIACRLAVLYGWKFAIFTPEHRVAKFYIKIIEMIIGRRAGSKNINPEHWLIVKKFVNDHFFYIKPANKDNSLDSVLDHSQTLVARKGIRGIIGDPWNMFEHNRPKELSETEYVSRELTKITTFCEVNNVLFMQVAHPTKMKKTKDGLHEIPTLYDISSSAHFYNKPYAGITVYRNHATKKTEIYIQKVKDDEIGKLGMAELEWNPVNGRLGVPGEPDNSNWLAPVSEQQTLTLELPPAELVIDTISGEEPPF